MPKENVQMIMRGLERDRTRDGKEGLMSAPLQCVGLKLPSIASDA